MAPSEPGTSPDERLDRPEYRVEGPAKVTGTARYAADVRLPGTLWLAHARSPIPRGLIVRIDTTAAVAAAGVHSVITGEDVRPARFGRRLHDWPVLAWDQVRFIGDRVAAVAAESRELARDAAELIEVDYEELPAVLHLSEALGDAAPIVHLEPDEYRYDGGPRPARSHPNVQGVARVTRGADDIEAVFAGADRVFEHEFTAPRQHQGHIEPHACLVWIDGPTVRVVSSNKTPFQLRQQMASTLGLAEDSIDVSSQFIGGDFGGKGMSLDEYACYFLARATGRPVRAVMDPAEELQAANPRHAASIRLRTGVDSEGRFLAHQSRVVFDGGAYAAAKPSAALTPAGGTLTLGSYVVPNVDLEVVTVYTNTVPGGHMRAPGETQALFASESHVDMIALALGLDPVELRLRNVIRDGQTGPTGIPFEVSRADEVLATIQTVAHKRGPLPRGHGHGVALSVRRHGGGKSSVVLRLRSDATIEAVTGAADQGGGSHTAIRRIMAVALSVAEERVHVTFGSTGMGPVDAGAGGSRLTFVTGRAAQRAATELKPLLEALAASRLGVPQAQVSLAHDQFLISAHDGLRQAEFDATLAGIETPDVIGVFDSRAEGGEEAVASFAGYLVEVGVDVDTGQVELKDVTLVADVGTIINPVAHQGQLNGGFVFGLGSGVMEELTLEDGRVMAAGLNEYKMPTAMDVPPFRTVLLPPAQGSGAYGAKAVGELANGAVSAAIANAVAAAVGARLHTYPVTSERVRDAVRSLRAGPTRDPGDSGEGL